MKKESGCSKQDKDVEVTTAKTPCSLSEIFHSTIVQRIKLIQAETA
jgi:hypothetical protein